MTWVWIKFQPDNAYALYEIRLYQIFFELPGKLKEVQYFGNHGLIIDTLSCFVCYLHRSNVIIWEDGALKQYKSYHVPHVAVLKHSLLRHLCLAFANENHDTQKK